MYIQCLLALLLCSAVPAVARAEPLGLLELEEGLDRREAIRQAEADMAVAEAVAQRAAANGGLRATTTLGLGAFTEPQYPSGTRDYGAASLGVGLRYPVFGSAAEEQLAVASARLDAVTAASRRDAARRALRRSLRESFFAYARAQAMDELVAAYLADAERIRDALRRRQEAGLVLESDRRQLEISFARAERERAAAAEELQLRGSELRRWRADFDGSLVMPERTALHIESAAYEEVEKALAERRTEEASNRLAAVDLPSGAPLIPARGNLFLNGTLRSDTDLGTGAGIIGGISLDWPLGSQATRGLEHEQAALVQRARLALEWDREEERQVAMRALAVAKQAAADGRLARESVAASGAALISAARRATLDQGASDAPIERWVSARAVMFDDLTRLLDAEIQQSLAASMLELVLEESGERGTSSQAVECRTAAVGLFSWRTLETGLPGDVTTPCTDVVVVSHRDSRRADSSTPSADAMEASHRGSRDMNPPSADAAATGRTRAYYAWDGSRAIERAAEDSFWRETRASELWLSFGAEELERLRRQPEAREALRAGLERLRARGTRAVLLLGEPTWLLPGHDERLFALVRELADLPFDAIHLDVEPVQLSPPMPAEQAWPALERLVRRTRELSEKPVMVSLNWRDLSPGPGESCNACGVAAAAGEVVVMLYSTSPTSVAERMSGILARKPAPRVWLAQSIEAALGAEESFAAAGRAALEAQFDTLLKLTDDPGFAGFAVQSLEDFVKARP